MKTSSSLIIVPAFNQAAMIESRLEFLQNYKCDILLVDDGSTDHTPSLLEEYEDINYIRHQMNLGIGSSVISGYEYARDLGYDFIITLDPAQGDSSEDISRILDNARYGYDIVTCSRILENYDHHHFSPERIETMSILSSSIMDCTGFDITDPLSGIMGLRTAALNEMVLSDSGHGLFLQLFIQAHYYGLSLIEIPTSTGYRFGDELELYDDPLGNFLSLIETEQHLYPRKSMN